MLYNISGSLMIRDPFLKHALRNHGSTRDKANVVSGCLFIISECVIIFLFVIQPMMFKKSSSHFVMLLHTSLGEKIPLELTNEFLFLKGATRNADAYNMNDIRGVLVLPGSLESTNVLLLFAVKNDSSVPFDDV